MSILLEALRKSEKSQQPREVPTIHTSDQGDPVKEPFRIGPVALLVVVALLVIGWLIWRQYQQPAGEYQPPVTLEAGDVRSLEIPSADATQSEPAPLVTKTTGNEKPRVRDRTPVESYQPPEKTASPAGVQNTNAGPAKKPASKKGESSSAFKRLANNRKKQAANNKANATATAATATDRKTPKKPAKAKQPQRDPRETEPISYWELPDAVRKSVPEIKFSVLVYAQRPADRFVLINGQRLGEGDAAQPGLVVKEIRLDGVVFSFRRYQFLVER